MLRYFFRQSLRLQGQYKCPNKKIAIVDYTDAYPLFAWSKSEGSQTSMQLRVLPGKNLVDPLPIAQWFESDDYNDCKLFGEVVYHQLNELKSIEIGEEIIIKKLGTGDGKNRREISGMTPATSSFPFPGAPIHKSQLMDMALIVLIMTTIEKNFCNFQPI